MTKPLMNRLRRLEASRGAVVVPCADCGAPDPHARKIIHIRTRGQMSRCPGCNRLVDDRGRAVKTPCVVVRTGVRSSSWTPGRTH